MTRDREIILYVSRMFVELLVVVLRASYQMSLAVSNTCLYSSLQLTQFSDKNFVRSFPNYSQIPNYPTLSNCRELQ